MAALQRQWTPSPATSEYINNIERWPMQEEQLAILKRLTERYCVVYKSLHQPPKIEVTIKAEE
jgi:uncharacterized OsmC-like protein